jgi:hypothetical protein
MQKLIINQSNKGLIFLDQIQCTPKIHFYSNDSGIQTIYIKASYLYICMILLVYETAA